MAGAGARLANIQKFLDIGLQEVHSSASKPKPSHHALPQSRRGDGQ